MHGLYQKCQWSLQAKKLHYKNKCYRSGAGEFGDPPMTRNGELHLCWRPLFLLRTQTNLKIEENKQMRPSLDHFGHHCFLSWGVCEAIPGSPRALLVQLGVVNTNAILHSWSLVDLQTIQHRCYNICFRSVFVLLVETIGTFGTDRAYRPRDRYRDHW